ncbi:13116_t:CDS:2, partial [Dentiscutata erythropus]
HINGYKQKRREYKYCEHHINDALRAAHTHFRNCGCVSSEQKKRYFGNLYKEEEHDSGIFDASTLVASASLLAEVVSTSTLVVSNLFTSRRISKNTRGENKLTEGEDENIEISESEIELLTESDIDNE